MGYAIHFSGSQTPVVKTRDAAVQCTLLQAPPLLQCNSPEHGASDMESENVSESGTDYCHSDTEDSDELEWYTGLIYVQK